MTTDTLDEPLDISVERLTRVLTSRDAKKLRLEFETVDGQTTSLSIPTSSVQQLITTFSLAEKLPSDRGRRDRNEISRARRRGEGRTRA
jgi:hypothetical protein